MPRIASFAILCVLAATAAWAQTPQTEIRANIAYGPDPAQRLDLCLPPAGQAGSRPAVILIHGGYWTLGDKGFYAGVCQMAAGQGIVAAAIDYRLADGSERHRWPAQLVDAQLAVRWLRSHAREFAVDPARICALGDSAGAHLAVFLAALDRTAPGDYSRELAAVSSKVACAVDNFGPVDLTADSFWPPIQQLFGNADRTQVKEQERAASPLFMIGAGAAPIMIVHGRDDKSVNIGQAQLLHDQLKRAHVPVRMTLVNSGHVFAGLPWPEIEAVYRAELEFIKGAAGRGP